MRAKITPFKSFSKSTTGVWPQLCHHKENILIGEITLNISTETILQFQNTLICTLYCSGHIWPPAFGRDIESKEKQPVLVGRGCTNPYYKEFSLFCSSCLFMRWGIHVMFLTDEQRSSFPSH